MRMHVIVGTVTHTNTYTHTNLMKNKTINICAIFMCFRM